MTEACPNDGVEDPKWRGRQSLVNRISPNLSGEASFGHVAELASEGVLTHRNTVASRKRAIATGRV
ncbi:hypothetical protein GCM10023170_043700 [Phytohabitans houttuyneae]|uniref:Uncharacterized protein n=1 Tax=Phytohabitans houttuyneae TaxID=1076126 RepID=A0A6V8K8V3_9ACTN|nr:hypothetical protein Phou_040900 [Phytohabitans houttuyneae]